MTIDLLSTQYPLAGLALLLLAAFVVVEVWLALRGPR